VFVKRQTFAADVLRDILIAVRGCWLFSRTNYQQAMRHKRMRNRTTTLLGLIASALLAFAAAIAPASRADQPRESKTLYLHLYSNRYDITSMGKLPPAPRDWQCIASVSVVSGHPFYFVIPCHYEPEMRMEGEVKRVPGRVEAEFNINVADVGPAYRHVQKTPIELNTLYDFGDGDFRFSISDSREPTGIKSQRPTPDNKAANQRSSVYAKIVLPMKLPGKGPHPVVESWIAMNLRKRGISEFGAVTHWVRLAGKGEQTTFVWNATVDGKGWGCPVDGKVVERTADGRVKVELSGWSPVGVEIKGRTLPDEIGGRSIAVVDSGVAYVALFVGPPVPNTLSADKQ
jgi:hypothetical protein